MRKEFLINRQGKEMVLYAGLLDEAHQQGLKRISTTLIQVPHDDNGNVAIVAAEVETEKGVFAGLGDASPVNVSRNIAPHLIRMAETRSKARALRDAVNVGATAVEEMGGDDDEDENGSSPSYSHRTFAKGSQDFLAKLLRENGFDPFDDDKMGSLSYEDGNALIEGLKRDRDAFRHRLVFRNDQPTNVQPARERVSDTDFAFEGETRAVEQRPLAATRVSDEPTANQLATISKLRNLLGQPRLTDDEQAALTRADASEMITDLSRAYNERQGAKGTRR